MLRDDVPAFPRTLFLRRQRSSAPQMRCKTWSHRHLSFMLSFPTRRSPRDGTPRRPTSDTPWADGCRAGIGGSPGGGTDARGRSRHTHAGAPLTSAHVPRPSSSLSTGHGRLASVTGPSTVPICSSPFFGAAACFSIANMSSFTAHAGLSQSAAAAWAVPAMRRDDGGWPPHPSTE